MFMSDTYLRLQTYDETLWYPGCPVMLEKSALLYDRIKNLQLLQCKFRNIQEKSIRSISVQITLFDHNNQMLGNPFSFQYSQLNVLFHGEFGSQTPIYLPVSNVAKFQIMLKEVTYTDQSRYLDGNILQPLPPFPDSQQSLYEKERKKSTKETAHLPLQKTRHKKRILIFSLLSVLALSLIIGIGYYSIFVIHPNHPYEKAEDDIHSGDYVKSIQNSADYEDSETQSKEIQYQEAGVLVAEGNYKEAIEYYKNIYDYKDSAQLQNQAKYNYAVQLLENGNFEDCFYQLNTLHDLKSFEGSDEVYLECCYQLGIQYTQEGKYNEAADKLNACLDYKDGRQKLIECADLNIEYIIETNDWRNRFSALSMYPPGYDRTAKEKYLESMLRY